MRAVVAASVATATLSLLGSRAAPPHAAPDRLGGPATVELDGHDSFGMAVPGLSTEDHRAFVVGNALFRDNWVAAPAAPAGRDGLGPLFNANSCSACHPDDGRGRPPLAPGEVGLGMVTFVSPANADGAPHPAYGRQLQDQAIAGVTPEVRIELAPEPVRGMFTDGTPWELQRWRVAIRDEAYGPLGAVRLSVRIGPQIVGGGLLEAVPDEEILARADPDDRDGDGISGRVHRLPDGRIGRFGWKASQATLEGQVQAALHEDIGITNDAHPEESLTAPERAAISAPSGGHPEADARKVQRIAHYCRTLAVPAERGRGTPQIERGRALFAAARCTACHAETLATGSSSPVEQLRNAEFHPYTDLLLHDMGDGLADDRRDGDATGREWRTPPLWGIGLVGTVNGHTRFLHDGRARSLEEAVLWHGGEAGRARDAFTQLPAQDRAALVAFLNSL